MNVAYKGFDAWEVMGIERDRAWFCIYLDCWVILGAEGKLLKLGAGGFMPPFEEESVVWAIDCDGCFVKHHAAVVVA